ncbi:MAG: inositol monophosphatase family protein [candidate division Zixibacteria bacterium]|nr:inositol monophosphatase family protein [candidate division Zixibacteria bacterium]
MIDREAEELSAFSRKLALKAGAILKKGFKHRLKVRFKGRIDPVTDADLKSEKSIIASIDRYYPRHEILTEESGSGGGKSPYRWIIDPLDGTVNYSHAFPVYGVSVALEYKGEIVLGAVYDPQLNEMFWARKGAGAFLNGKKIHVSPQNNLQRALLATGFAYDISTARRNNLGLFARLAKKAEGIRRLGSAALDLCWLAAGRLDGFWELKLHPWDTAAAKIIVEEAGGKITRFKGEKYSIFDKEILATNGKLHPAMKKVLAG